MKIKVENPTDCPLSEPDDDAFVCTVVRGTVRKMVCFSVLDNEPIDFPLGCPLREGRIVIEKGEGEKFAKII